MHLNPQKPEDMSQRVSERQKKQTTSWNVAEAMGNPSLGRSEH